QGAARRSACPLRGCERRRIRGRREPSSRPSLSVKPKAEEEGTPRRHPCLCNSFRTPGTRRGLRGGPGTEDAGCSATFPLSQEGVFCRDLPRHTAHTRAHTGSRGDARQQRQKPTSVPIPTPAGRSGEDARLLRAAGDGVGGVHGGTRTPPGPGRDPLGGGHRGARAAQGRGGRAGGRGRARARLRQRGEEEGGTVSVGWSGNPVIKRGARGKSREKLRTRPLFPPPTPSPQLPRQPAGTCRRHSTARHRTAPHTRRRARYRAVPGREGSAGCGQGDPRSPASSPGARPLPGARCPVRVWERLPSSPRPVPAEGGSRLRGGDALPGRDAARSLARRRHGGDGGGGVPRGRTGSSPRAPARPAGHLRSASPSNAPSGTEAAREKVQGCFNALLPGCGGRHRLCAHGLAATPPAFHTGVGAASSRGAGAGNLWRGGELRERGWGGPCGCLSSSRGHRASRVSASLQAALRGAPASVHERCEAGRHPQAIAMDFVMKQALGGATKDMGKMLGGDEEKDPDAAKKEEERQEALRQEEEERKAKYAKMEAEREVMRQGIRDKYGIKKKEEKEAEAQAALEANAEGSLTRPKKAIPPGCGDEEEEEEESILDTVIKYLPGPLQDMFKK
uniref:Complexin-1 n=1 Tax=Cairina moschata TaxID=8855 RepID=A0A8C3CY29_CAIMO